MGDFEGAVADFSSAISLDPGNADFYHNRGFSLRKQVGFAAAACVLVCWLAGVWACWAATMRQAATAGLWGWLGGPHQHF